MQIIVYKPLYYFQWSYSLAMSLLLLDLSSSMFHFQIPLGLQTIHSCLHFLICVFPFLFTQLCREQSLNVHRTF